MHRHVKSISTYIASVQQRDRENCFSFIGIPSIVRLIVVVKKSSLNLMRNIEVYEEVRLKSLLNLPLNAYKKMKKNIK